MLFQSVNGTGFLALLAKDALGGVLSVARIAVDFHIHRTNLQALVAVDAFFLVAFDAEPREVAHRFQETVIGQMYLQKARLSFRAQARMIPTA